MKNEKQPSISITEEQKNKFKANLKTLNNKPFGHKVSIPEYFEFLTSLVTPENLKEFKKTTLGIDDELILYRQRYIKKVEPISEKGFLKYAISPDFQKFRKENKDALEVF